MAPLERRTLAEQLYQQMRSSILDDSYGPGMELQEVALAEEFGVSRGPVREALRRLASEGLVTFTPRRGAVVRSLTRKDFLDAYRVREALELLAVRLATPLLGEADFARLEAYIDSMDAAVKDDEPSTLLHQNHDFHMLFVERTDNAMLLATYKYVVDSIGRYQRWSVDLRGDLSSITAEHRAILDRVRAGDVEGAVAVSREHIRVPLERLRDDDAVAAGTRQSATPSA